MKILGVMSLSALGVFFLTAPVGFADVTVNEQAPDFTLSDTNGEQHSLSQYHGKFVVLEWMNYECPFIKKHYNSQNMQSLQKEFTKKGVIWFSINSSAEGKQGYFLPEQINALMKERGAQPTAYLIDKDGTTGKMYGALTTPHMFIVNPEGKLIYKGAIDDKPSVDPEDIPGAHNYVRAALEEAMAGKPVSVSLTKSYGCSVKY